MKKIRNFGKKLSKTEQKKIIGGLQLVTCSISGGCTCPGTNPPVTYTGQYECLSCTELSGGGGYTCYRGDWSKEITCESEKKDKCGGGEA